LEEALDYCNILCLRAFLSLHNFELDALAFFQIAVAAIIVEGGLMHENIRSSSAFNESVAFATIEPFDCTLNSFCHGLELLSL